MFSLPEWMDILFGTKTQDEGFEDMSSSFINMFIFVIFVLVLKETKYDPILYLKKIIGTK